MWYNDIRYECRMTFRGCHVWNETEPRRILLLLWIQWVTQLTKLHAAESFLRSFSCSGSQEIFRLLWNLKVHYHVYKNPSLVPILSQIHPVYIFPSYLSNIHFSIIFPSTSRSSEWFLPFRCLRHFSVASSTVVFDSWMQLSLATRNGFYNSENRTRDPLFWITHGWLPEIFVFTFCFVGTQNIIS
jgi:hypothetical protein